MDVKSARFLTAATNPRQYPDHGLPEIAFFGKSNAGKSTLINLVVHRHHLVKTSNRPGQTQEINFFLVNEALGLVDLPGLGYAKASHAIRERLEPMVWDYCSGRANLKLIFFLQDLRRDLDEGSEALLDGLGQTGKRVCVVGTKADKLGSNDKTRQKKRWLEVLQPRGMPLIITSSLRNQGQDQIWLMIREATGL